MTDIDTQETEVEQTQTDAPSELEERARRMGWKPKEEYRGPQDKWVDADKFMEITDTHMGLKDKEVKLLTNEVRELKQAMRQMVEGQALKVQREVQRRVAELEAERDQAVESGDLKRYRAVSKEINDYTAELRDETAPAQAFTGWLSENDWYETDEDLRAYADGIGPKLMAGMGWDGKSVPTRKMYDAVSKRVRERFPDHFGETKAEPTQNPRRAAGSATEGRTTVVPPRNRSKGWDDIPAEDRNTVMNSRLIGTHSQAIYKDREAYAKAYWKTYGAAS